MGMGIHAVSGSPTCKRVPTSRGTGQSQEAGLVAAEQPEAAVGVQEGVEEGEAGQVMLN